MKRLISKKDLANTARLKESSPVLPLLSNLSGVKKVNKAYDRIGSSEREDFMAALLEYLNLSVEVEPADLEKIPESGAFITVSNHPYGPLDSILLAHLMTSKRDDFKVLSNDMLHRVPQMEPFVIPLADQGIARKGSKPVMGLRTAIQHLQVGGGLGLFPAGEVSSPQQGNIRTVLDKPWQESAVKMIQHQACRVLPIYIDGKNSNLYHFLGFLHPSLKTLAIPAEVMKKKDQTVKVRIGNVIQPRELAEFKDREQLGRFLRARCYALGSAMERQKKGLPKLQRPERAEKLIEAVPQGLLSLEIEQLYDRKLFGQGDMDCYMADAAQIPNTLREISRLREKTFREVDEGTGKSCDTDEYDAYYKHLFLWDRKARKLVGAYRIGMGAEIMHRFGKRGFYTSTLFIMEDPLDPVLEQSIELGRSFICSEYQRHRLPLFMLWQGILSVLIAHPGYRYVLGPVSISNHYQDLSKGLMVEFVKKHYFNLELAQHIRARHEFVVKAASVDSDALLSASADDMRKLDKIISDIEPSRYTLPILLKKYLQQNARIIGFNRDPQFSDALDGLMILDLQDVPDKTIDNLKKGLEAGYNA